MSAASDAVRTYARHAPRLVALSAIALSPVVAFALATPAAPDLAHAQAQRWLPWLMIALAYPLQLILVAGVAPVMRGERSVMLAGLRGMIVAIAPCAVAMMAIALGLFALAIPGLILLVLLSLTGASEHLGESLPVVLADSVRAARAELGPTVAVVLSILVADVAIAEIAKLALVHDLVKGATPALLARPRLAIRAIAAALVVLSPIGSTALAAVYRSSSRP